MDTVSNHTYLNSDSDSYGTSLHIGVPNLVMGNIDKFREFTKFLCSKNFWSSCDCQNFFTPKHHSSDENGFAQLTTQ